MPGDTDEPAQCSICAEDYEESGPRAPLLFACCKGGECCSACLQKHVTIGNARCIICSKRPTRHYIKDCERGTPANYLMHLQKKAVDEQLAEPMRRTCVCMCMHGYACVLPVSLLSSCKLTHAPLFCIHTHAQVRWRWETAPCETSMSAHAR